MNFFTYIILDFSVIFSNFQWNWKLDSYLFFASCFLLSFNATDKWWFSSKSHRFLRKKLLKLSFLMKFPFEKFLKGTWSTKKASLKFLFLKGNNDHNSTIVKKSPSPLGLSELEIAFFGGDSQKKLGHCYNKTRNNSW